MVKIMNKKFYFTSHKDSGNRGCEAITRGTIEILKLKKEDIYIFSDNIEEDKKCKLDEITNFIEIKKYTFKQKIFIKVLRKLNSDKLRIYQQIYFKHLNRINKNDIAFSTGGDMFCYGINEVPTINNYLNSKKIKTVLWGCSIGKENIDDVKLETLKKYSLITVRENLTKNLLIDELGLKNVKLYPDPAFVLKEKKCNLPNYFFDKKVIGINVSNFVNKGFKLDTDFSIKLIELIKYIVKKTDLFIVLIPHVFWEGQDDRILSMEIKKYFFDTKRIDILNSDELSYCQIRYAVSKCSFFIGARTHSVISAYSMKVPTLALGYSVKARGIASDLGLCEELVVDCSKNNMANSLIDSFDYLYKNEKQIKSHLEKIMPNYINDAYNAINCFDF